MQSAEFELLVGGMMGSRGSGRISDYPGSSQGGAGSTGESKGGTSGSGEAGAVDRCALAFSTELEDVEHSEYYASHGHAPPIGEPLRIRHEKRLIAETIEGESVGNLPTSRNYLASCLKEGWTYTGIVTASSNGPPVATVLADFAATAPS